MENCRERGDKSLMEEFFNSLKEIVQKLEFKRCENAVHMQSEQRPVDRLVDRHAQFGAQQQFGQPTGTSQFSVEFGRPFGRPTGTSTVSVGGRSTEQSTEGRVGRPSDRRIC